MKLWLIFLAAGLLTYAMRLSFILLWGKIDVPVWLQRALRFVPPAVLTAIFFPELFMPGGTLDLSPGNARLIAGILAALVAWRTRNIVLTILVGMGVLLLIQYFS
jgi:branched-subunit amino acid transport protein